MSTNLSSVNSVSVVILDSPVVISVVELNLELSLRSGITTGCYVKIIMSLLSDSGNLNIPLHAYKAVKFFIIRNGYFNLFIFALRVLYPFVIQDPNSSFTSSLLLSPNPQEAKFS